MFIALVSRVILAFDLNLYIPLSKVDENMRRAHARSAHRTQKFWFRKHMGAPAAGTVGDPDAYEEMTIEEILTGKGEYFPGLMPLVRAYLEAIGCDPETGEKVRPSLTGPRACSAAQRSAAQCNARLSAVQCSAVQCTSGTACYARTHARTHATVRMHTVTRPSPPDPCP